jgi:bifunctional DNase/RNase
MHRMTVKSLKRANGDEAILVLQTAEADRYLGFVVPMNEANRLARALGLSGCRCSPICDLLLALSLSVEARLERAVLDGASEGIGATLVFQHRAREIALECHPADAVALAVRVRAPIFATPTALAHACPAEAHARHEGDDTARWLATVRPEDFGAVQPES